MLVRATPTGDNDRVLAGFSHALHLIIQRDLLDTTVVFESNVLDTPSVMAGSDFGAPQAAKANASPG